MAQASKYSDTIWAGSESSYEVAARTHAAVLEATLKFGPQSLATKNEEQTPWMFTRQGDIGVVSIRGPLINEAPNFFTRMFRQATYGDIREAMLYAAEQKAEGLKAVLLDVDSGGGAVSGVDDTGSLIRQIDANILPVYAFTDGDMASAAYWLGSAGREVYNSKSSLVGSIGVLIVHSEISKMAEDGGVKNTVIRSGKYKALANRYEPLTDNAKAQLQARCDASYDVFIEAVAEHRGVSAEVVDSKMAQGREFNGAAAVTAGLSDGIKSFDAVMSHILDSVSDTSNNSRSTSKGANLMKKALTEQHIAAIAAGATSELTEEQKAEQQAAAEAAEKETAAATDEGKGEEIDEPAVKPELVGFLQSQLKDANAEILSLKISAAKSQETIDSMSASHAGLVAIAAKSVSNMKVALGLSALDLSTMSAEALLAEHASTSETFKSKFQTGGVAAVDPAKDETAAPVISPLHKAHIAATRISN